MAGIAAGPALVSCLKSLLPGGEFFGRDWTVREV